MCVEPARGSAFRFPGPTGRISRTSYSLIFFLVLSIEAVVETSPSRINLYLHVASSRPSRHHRFLSCRGLTCRNSRVGLDTRRLSAGRIRVKRFSTRGKGKLSLTPPLSPQNASHTRAEEKAEATNVQRRSSIIVLHRLPPPPPPPSSTSSSSTFAVPSSSSSRNLTIKEDENDDESRKSS
ncbi:hypothetical protein PIB30_003140 [Stylosanthes scabra]|uniref:Uncharacterized protein n=1 Tax=Stylosanthes scabra TaxID=79078 RepID=A0ABU6Y1T9_9FABA|nr:hypothetical protein [Stylosanthes scabra]